MSIFLIIRILIGTLFVFSGLLKYSDLASFNETIEAFRIIPSRYSSIIYFFTISIPSIEIICGIALICNHFRKKMCMILLVLMIIFTIAVSIDIHRGIIIDCGCFGILDIFGKLSLSKIFFNMSIVLLLIVIYFKSDKYKDKLL